MAEVWTFIACAIVITASIPLAIWLKRAGDENWRRHQRRMVSIRLVANVAKFSAACVAMSAAMSKMVPAAIEMERSMAKLRATLTTKADQ